MTARRELLGVIGGLVILLAGCGTSSASFRYRMTVEGGVSGSAVYELLAEKVRFKLLADEKSGGSIISGEAMVIETPSGSVFALLRSVDGDDTLRGAVVRALAPNVSLHPVENYMKAVRKIGRDRGLKAELPRTDWPMMVRFRDLNDPKTVEQVDPASIGVKRIVLETTGDAVTLGIEKKLTWLGGRGLVVSGPTINPNLTQTIRHGAFWQEPN